jgi:hypothetical protein
VQVSKRLAIFIQGFDSRGLAEYYGMFQREFARACALYKLTGDVGPPRENSKRFTGEWDVTTSGNGWQVETHYMFLRWDDLIQEDLSRAVWWKIVQLYRTIGVAMLNGAFRRMLRAGWRYSLFALLPLALITAWIFFGTFFGVLCMNLVLQLRAPELVAKIVGSVTGIGGFASILWLTEPMTKLLQRCDAAATVDQIANRKRKDIDARLAAFAGDVVDAVRRSDADEVVITGHGLGAALAIDVLGRALIREPALGEEGPRVVLLTLGANLPVVGFDPEAGWFRNRLRQVAVDPNVDWVDIQSRDDVLNFCPFDPVAGHDIVLEDDERRNPHVVAVSFRDLWKPGDFALRRWRLFEAHFQYLRASERLGAVYDYPLICCGPVDLMTRATKPQEAIAAQ